MIKIFTDGSCLQNPGGCGGWAFVVSQYEDITITDTTEFFCGGHNSTTNNAMELQGILEALRWCEENGKNNVFIYSDSKYAMNVCNAWSHLWARNGWTNREGKGIANSEIVKHIYNLGTKISYHVEWVPGHSGNPFNEFADSLANKMALRFQGKDFAKFSNVELNDRISVKAKLFKVSAKFISSGTLVLQPVFNKKLKTLILDAKDFDEQQYIKI